MAPVLDTVLDALAQPLRSFGDPAERIYWVFLLGALVMPLALLGLRRGWAELRRGLLRPALWTSASSRADVLLIFAKALLFGLWKLPWLAATTGAALWVGLSLHRWFGAPDIGHWDSAWVVALYSLVLFVSWDLSRFVLHLAMHRVGWLWRFHQVHHSAEVLTPLTLFRTHPLESLLLDVRGLVTTAVVAGVFSWLFPGQLRALEIVGVGALGWMFNAAGSNLRHSHVWLRFGRFERWFISPAQHQLHHARDPRLASSNYGTYLALWDRVNDSWRAAPTMPPAAYGLEHADHDPTRVLSLLLDPLRIHPRGGRRRGIAATAAAIFLLPKAAESAPPRAVEGPSAVQWPSDAPEGPADASDGQAVKPDGPTHAAERSTDGPREPSAQTPPADPPPIAAPAPSSSAPSSATPSPATPSAGAGTEAAPIQQPGEHRTVHVSSMFDGGAAPRTAGSAHVVDERELARREYDDIGRVVANVPGVYVRGEDGYGLRPNIGLRGANPDRSAKVNLMEDGILLGPAPYSAPAAYYFPLTTRLVGIEVFKGPASVKYGPNTIGGAINLRTREVPLRHASTVDLAGGRFGYFKGHGFYGTSYKGFGVLIEAARVQTTGFKDLDGGGDTGFGKNDAMLKLSYTTPSGRDVSHSVEAKLGYATERSDETYLGLSAADFARTPYRRYRASALDKMSWWRSQAELSYVLSQRDTIELDVRLYRHDFVRLWRRLDAMRGAALSDVLAAGDTGQNAVSLGILRGEQDGVLPDHALLVANNRRRFVSQGVQTAFRWRPRAKIVEQELELGVRLHHDFIERDHSSDAFQMTSGALLPEGTPRESTADNRGETIAGAFHLFDAITLWRRLTLAPGIRLEVIDMRFRDRLAGENNRRRDTAVSPGIGALVKATPWLSVFAGAHRGFSPVTPGQPKAVRAETSMNYELGARARAIGFAAEAVGFLSDYRNLNAVCTFSSGCTDGDGANQYNAGAALVWGLESMARYRREFAGRFYFELGANYTYTGTRFQESFGSSFIQWGDVEEGDELPYVPRHVLGGSTAIGGERWEISAAPNFTSAMRDVAGHGKIPSAEKIPGFFVLDVSALARPLPRLATYLQISNVTNNAYAMSLRPFGLRPGAPLTFIVGVKIDAFH